MNLQTRLYGTALQAASVFGRIEVMSLLVARGGSVNLQGGMYGNALCAASGSHNGDTVKLLLEYGADILLEGSDNKCALVEAAKYGTLETVRFVAAETVKADADESHLRRVLKQAIKATEDRVLWLGSELEIPDIIVKLLTDHLSVLEPS